ncbi:ABC transporter permease subunit [Cryobacterium sp. PH31-O1]|uniref:amino acid ABC transporter permease n=1 Tax=Cryobacterium sp. PH31-O1 TaxID=3046306 RepID=UPI0024BA8FC4|nr:ABC transporter permease subunit [Cryobacterium sp. PH31-O1]MDJ0336695.1 ABC transporter permease subunit [Cryobacterium sp. PH31-O1]
MLGVAGYIALGIGATLLITASAFTVGGILALPLALAQRSRFVLLRIFVRVVVNVVRAVPPLVWLFLVFFGFSELGLRMSPLAAAIATFSVIAMSYFAEIYRAGLSALNRGQEEASAALGMSTIDSYRFIVVPQVFRVVGPMMATYGIGLLKDSALASTIGVVELTFRAGSQAQQTGQGLTVFAIVGLIYLLLSLPLAIVSRHVDSRLRARFSVA